MNNFVEPERPGTSFTSKRQVRTQQSRRQQMNIGTLETEDPIQRPVTNQTNYTPSDDKLRKFLFRQSKGGGNFSQKNIPRQMVQDKERLYEEGQQYKMLINQLKNENNRLKTRCLNLEEEGLRTSKLIKQNTNTKLIDAFYSDEKNPDSQQKSSSLIYELKKANTELKNEIQRKDQIIQSIKKDQTFQQCKELEMQVSVYQNETIRLRQMLDQALALEQRDDYDQNIINALNTFKQDNLEMASLIKSQEKEIEVLQIRVRESNAKVKKYLQETKVQKRLIAELEKEIQQIKNRDAQFNGHKKQANEIEQALRAELDQKISEINSSNNQLAIKEKSKQDLEKRMKQMQSEFEQKIDVLEREKSIMQERIVNLREEMQNFQASVSSTNITSGKRRTIMMQSPTFQPNDVKTLVSIDEEEGNDEQQFEEIKRLPIIQKEEIIDIGRKLRYQLKNQHIEIKDLTQYLFEDHTETITIAQLQQNLKLYPFDLDEISSLKIARYLVEDNNEQYVMFSFQMSSPVPYVRSILKTFLGNYEILNSNQEQILRTEISQLMTKYRYSARDTIIKLKQLHRTHLIESRCLIDQFLESIVDANFNTKQIDFILSVNYHLTGCLNEIDYEQLFRHFHYEEQQQKPTIQPVQLSIDIPINKQNDSPKSDSIEKQQDQELSNFQKPKIVILDVQNEQQGQLQMTGEDDHKDQDSFQLQMLEEETKNQDNDLFQNRQEQENQIEKNQQLELQLQLDDNKMDERKQNEKEHQEEDLIEQNQQFIKQVNEEGEDNYDGYNEEFEQDLNINSGELNAKDHQDYDQ